MAASGRRGRTDRNSRRSANVRSPDTEAPDRIRQERAMAARPSPAPADEAHPLHYAPSHRTDHSALSAQLIDGKAVAATVHERVSVAVATRTAAGHRAQIGSASGRGRVCQYV